MKFFPTSEKAKRNKYLASRLPSNWPSYLHNKCNDLTCTFPNPPQAAEGTFNCQGYGRGSLCQGTYYVSRSTVEDLKLQVKRDDQERWRREEREKRMGQIAAELERQKIVKSHLDETGTKMAAKEVASKYAEKKRIKDTSTDFSTGSSTDDNSKVYTSLGRRAAQRKKPPTCPKSTDPKDACYTSNKSELLALYPPAARNYTSPPTIDQYHLYHLPSRTSSRSHGSKSTTKYPATADKYYSPQCRPPVTQDYGYRHRQSPRWF